MSLIEVIFLAAALSVDSMAVSMSGSVSLGNIRWNKVLYVSGVLALVQTVFLMTGYFAGDAVSAFVERFGVVIGFALLVSVGADMIVGAIRGKEESNDFTSIFKLLVAAVATSIDAAACGASFGITRMPIRDLFCLSAATFAATALFSVSGMFCGSAAGRRFGRPAKIAAGIVLIVIALNILFNIKS